MLSRFWIFICLNTNLNSKKLIFVELELVNNSIRELELGLAKNRLNSNKIRSSSQPW